MSKKDYQAKDYQAIAAALYQAKRIDLAGFNDARPDEVFAFIEARLLTVFKANNPRFDCARFLEACETGR